MEIKNIEDCFKFRLLRRISPDISKAKRSIALAVERINEAQEIMKIMSNAKSRLFNHIIVDAYTGMFHAARAILYKDGIQEKSHYATFIYLKEKYSNKVPFSVLNLLNIYRVERHEALYGIDFKPTEEEASLAISDAKLFIKEIEKVLK